jgi:ParB/RepB/Spo0J family partition protein
MELELHQLELRYEKLRRRNAHKERQLVASLADKGQLLPVVVVKSGESSGFVLVDGYKRVRAHKSLRNDTVSATLWELGELDALLLERIMRTGEADGALEQGWLLEELQERFALSHDELARRFDKSQSWVSRRLALVRALPSEVQERVQSGALPAHAAMKYLVPMVRAKRADCLRLITALGQSRPSTREVGALYRAWACGNAQTRELVVTQPAVVLRARQQATDDVASENTPGKKLLDDFGIVAGTSRRARQKLVQGLLAQLLPTELGEARRAARLAQSECEALFDSASALLQTSSPATDLATAACEPPSKKEIPSAR